jgi:hypothetical protein
MLRIVNVILIISIAVAVFFIGKDTRYAQKEEVIEIYPGDTGDEYDRLIELFGSEKASTE